jgi:hypothetical protein
MSESGQQSERPAPKSSPANHPWPLNVFIQEWPNVKAARVSFALCVLALTVLFGGGIYWFLDHLYSAEIRGKNAELAQKAETIRTISEERDKANRENEKLSKQYEGLRIYRAQDAPPIKMKSLILAQQIHGFTKDWKDTDPPNVQSDNVQKYLQRFGLRASIMRDDLDQNGQQSDAFDKVMYNFSGNYQDVRTIASEIEKLARNLPD